MQLMIVHIPGECLYYRLLERVEFQEQTSATHINALNHSNSQ